MKTTLVLLLLLSGSASALTCQQQETPNHWLCWSDLGPAFYNDPLSPLQFPEPQREYAWYVQPTSLGHLEPPDSFEATLHCYGPFSEVVTGTITLETRTGDQYDREEATVYCQPGPRYVEIPWWELWSRNAACYYGFSYCYYDPWEWDYY